jgi:hypothetical protein
MFVVRIIGDCETHCYEYCEKHCLWKKTFKFCRGIFNLLEVVLFEWLTVAIC